MTESSETADFKFGLSRPYAAKLVRAVIVAAAVKYAARVVPRKTRYVVSGRVVTIDCRPAFCSIVLRNGSARKDETNSNGDHEYLFVHLHPHYACAPFST